jgi:hypothetical protein
MKKQRKSVVRTKEGQLIWESTVSNLNPLMTIIESDCLEKEGRERERERSWEATRNNL